MIFFDLDDTLFDYQSAKNAAVAAFVQHAQRTLSAFSTPAQAVALWDEVTCEYMEQYHRGLLSYAQQQQKRVAAFLGIDVTCEQASAWYDRYQTVYEQHWQAFDDVMPTLKSIAQFNMPMAIITDGPAQQQRKLQRLGIAPFFAHMTIPAEVGSPKPEPKIFALAARKAQCAPQDCWYVGNHYQKDFIGALQAGFNSVWLNRSGKVSARQQAFLRLNPGRAWHISRLDELLPLLC